MQPAEMLYRGQQALRGFLEAKRLAGAARVPEFRNPAAESWTWPVDNEIAPAPYVRASEQILAGKIDLIARAGIEVGSPPRWTRNPLSGHETPSAYGKGLDYRNVEMVGDVKYIWVLNRHHQWTTVAQAYALTRNPACIDYLRKEISSWLRDNPYLMGINWTSALELAMRLINWSFVWSWTGGSRSALFDFPAGDALRSAFLKSVYQQVDFIRNHLSRYSSANNHLIGELAGIHIATRLWPLWPEFDKWGAEALQELDLEAHRQNYVDGVNKEQATFYQLFVLEFLVLAGLVARGCDDSLSNDYWARIERLLSFLNAIRDCGGNVPLFGDTDGCMVAPIGKDAHFNTFGSILTWGAAFFERTDFLGSASAIPDDYCRWLLGPQVAMPSNADAKDTTQARAFKEGGYYILGKDFGSPNEIKIIADAGPLGYLSLSAHGHADALSFVVSRAGRQWLVDPGTYCYQAEEDWRRYFKSTAAHNTLVVDGANQSIYEGKFLWGHKANVTLHEWSSTMHSDRLIASHDGYIRLNDPVTHRRDLLFEKSNGCLRIVDTVECGARHEVYRYLHFAEGCEVRVLQPGLIEARRHDGTLLVECGNGVIAIDLLRGSSTPPGGWLSRAFGQKVEITTVRIVDEIEGSKSLHMILKWADQ